MEGINLTAKADVNVLDIFRAVTMEQLDAIGDIVQLTDIIPKNMMTLLYAAGGVGKSTLAGAQIKEILANHPNEHILMLDSDQAMIRNRDMLKELIPLERFRSVSITTSVEAENIIDALLGLESLKDTVIVVDALQGMFAKLGGDINKATDAGRIMDRFKLIRDNGATVIIIHHSNKIDKDGFATFRGSAVIQDSVDNLYEIQGVSRTDTKLTVRVIMEHKYSFIVSNPVPVYEIDRKLNYIAVDETTKTEVVPKAPKGITEEQLEEVLTIISLHTGKQTGEIEVLIKDYLLVGIVKVKDVIVYLKSCGRVKSIKLSSGTNKYTLDTVIND